jgi:hypothetical protein
LIRIQVAKSDGSSDYRGPVRVLHGSVELSEAGASLRIRLVCATQENRNCDDRKQIRTSFHGTPSVKFISRTSKRAFLNPKNYDGADDLRYEGKNVNKRAKYEDGPIQCQENSPVLPYQI